MQIYEPSPADFERGPLVYLAGGLGNQIFMLASGWALAKKHGTPLFVDTSFYSAKRFRAPEILLCPTPAINLGQHSPWQSQRFPGGRVIPYPRNVLAVQRPPLFDMSARRTAVSLARSGPNRTLIGYFQSFRFFPGLDADIAAWLRGYVHPGGERNVTRKLHSGPFVCLHIRRGDLLSGLRRSKYEAPLDYFAEAISRLPAKAKGLPLVIFTDSRDSVRREIQAHEVLSDLPFQYFDDTGMSSLEVLVSMSEAQHFVLSSSTFGFWACWLAHVNEQSEITVFSPAVSRRFWDDVIVGFSPAFI